MSQLVMHVASELNFVFELLLHRDSQTETGIPSIALAAFDEEHKSHWISILRRELLDAEMQRRMWFGELLHVLGVQVEARGLQTCTSGVPFTLSISAPSNLAMSSQWFSAAVLPVASHDADNTWGDASSASAALAAAAAAGTVVRVHMASTPSSQGDHLSSVALRCAPTHAGAYTLCVRFHLRVLLALGVPQMSSLAAIDGRALEGGP